MAARRALVYDRRMATKLAAGGDPNDDLWAAFLHAAMHDDGAAAEGHLAAGRAIYYSEPDTPSGVIIKEYPDGHRELIRFEGRDEVLVRPLA